MIAYRTMRPEDIPAGLSLCRSAGWNQTARDWELFLALSPQGCQVGIDEAGKIAGTVTTVRYQDHFSWVGMVLVDPSRQRQGIGTSLLQESFKILSQEKTIKLDATPAGREVYLKLNFADEYTLSRMHISAMPVLDLPFPSARPVTQNDWPAVMNLDREIFGADREAVLRWLWESAPQYAFLSEEKEKIKGYCFGRPGHNFAHIGPVITQDTETAISLACAAFQTCTGLPVVLDAPHHSKDWLDWLSAIGFVEQRPFIRMYRGSNAYPGVPSKQFAILGPEFG